MDWPTSTISRNDLARLSDTHTVQLLPAYDLSGELLMPHDYDRRLSGALVHLRLSLNRYPFPLKGSPRTHRFVADIERVWGNILLPSVSLTFIRRCKSSTLDITRTLMTATVITIV